MTEPSFAEFDAATFDDWVEAARASLRGRSLESLVARSYEGIDIQPLPHADRAAERAVDGMPGQFPYLRGARAGGYRARPWLIAGELDISDPGEFNRALRDGLANGQTAITIAEDLRMNTAADIRLALADIDLGRFPLFIQSDADAPEIYEWLATALDDEALASLRGCVGLDPFGGLARSGFMRRDAYARMAAHLSSLVEKSPQLGGIAVSTAAYHDAGANAIQELAVAIATGVAYLRELSERGIAAATSAPKLHFFLSIGENFFLEIAKVRAIRLLWAQVLRALGLPPSATELSIHARSGRRNKSRRDAHVNLLRLSTEALAAAIGGVDSICLPAYDEPLGASNDFSRRLSRNIQLILQEELRLVELIDPAGGAWHVETLTDQLARQAWKRFQTIEAEGGLLASLRSGVLQAEIEAVAEGRRRDLAAGDAILVGCNEYVNPDETLPALKRETARKQTGADDRSIRVKKLKGLRLAEPFEAANRS